MQELRPAFAGRSLSPSAHHHQRLDVFRSSVGWVDVNNNLRAMSRDAVKNALRGHRAERQLAKVATFEIFRDGIVKGPEGATLEFFVTRIAEFLNGTVNVASGESLGVHKVDEKISGTITGNFRLLVKGDTVFHVIPMRNHAGDSIRQHAGKIRDDVGSMAAGELHIRREAKIFTDQHAIADAHAGGEALVVSIAQTENDFAIRASNVKTLEGKAAEVTLATTGKRMLFKTDFKTSAGDGIAGEIHKLGVWNRSERIGALRSLHADELFRGNLVLCDDEGHNVVGLGVGVGAPSVAMGKE